MTTGAFSQNVSKLFSELKLVTDNLSLYVSTNYPSFLQTSMTLNVKSRYKIMLTYTHVHMFAICYMFGGTWIVQTRIKHIDAFISQS